MRLGLNTDKVGGGYGYDPFRKFKEIGNKKIKNLKIPLTFSQNHGSLQIFWEKHQGPYPLDF